MGKVGKADDIEPIACVDDSIGEVEGREECVKVLDDFIFVGRFAGTKEIG